MKTNSIIKLSSYLLLIVLATFSCSNSTDSSAYNPNRGGTFLRDTLELRAHFADCGEWGGHHEIFEVVQVKLKHEFSYKYTRDTIDCPNPQLSTRRIVERREGSLSYAQWKLIEKYLGNLLNKSFDREGFSNAADLYIAQQKGYDYSFDSTPILNLTYSNYRMDWNGYKELKDHLLIDE